ncbi:MAG: 2-oxoacid:acceptor oxidoreductase family protein [Synergistaceae bacterium]|jgi:2-oxoglutarate ferredoxin oxidoreductase subunit gamma|nr:2-oxoacid:acceptor oxidoreductase family protein [Synergistaceae bacterium]
MTRKEILISGFGGQGIVTAGRILGHASTLQGLSAAMLVSHGTETRGGYVRSQVVISEEAIDSPIVEKPNIFCAMSQAAYNRFFGISRNGVILYDPDLVKRIGPPSPTYLAIHAGAAARELGIPMSANMVMLGAILRTLGMISDECMKDAIAAISPRFTELNLMAFEAGYRT